jgi:hypothetical protein
MEYSFGIFKPIYKGTIQDWNQLQNKIAWCINDLTIYPKIVVQCPHCGSINVHNLNNQKLYKHIKCSLYRYNGYYIYYECPGYKIGIITE